MEGRTNPTETTERPVGRPPSSLMARLGESSSSHGRSVGGRDGRSPPSQDNIIVRRRPPTVAGGEVVMGGRSSIAAAAVVGRSSSLAAAAAAAAARSSSGAFVDREGGGSSSASPPSIGGTVSPPDVVVHHPPPPPVPPSTTDPPHRRGGTNDDGTSRSPIRVLDAPPPPSSSSTMYDRRAYPHPPPPPFHMCTEIEAMDRAACFELSPFECAVLPCAPDDHHRDRVYRAHHHPPGRDDDGGAVREREQRRAARPTYDPRYVVKKYRRSAAGGGTTTSESIAPCRTIDQLDVTVDHLLRRIFAYRRGPPPPPVNDDASARDPDGIVDIRRGGGRGNDRYRANAILGKYPGGAGGSRRGGTFSLSETVGFVDDRLRAVQKDLVTLLGNLPPHECDDGYERAATTRQTALNMQAMMIRYGILTSYLLSDVPSSKYEASFGLRALRAALTCHATLCSDISHHGHRGGAGKGRVHGEDINVVTDDEDDVDDGERGRRSRFRGRQGRLDGGVGLPSLSSSCSTSSYRAEARARDEMAAYAAILHSSAVIRHAEEGSLPSSTGMTLGLSLMDDGGNGLGALLLQTPPSSSSLRRGRVTEVMKGAKEEDNNDKGDVWNEYPRWKWALEMACAAQEGNFQRYFSLLDSGPVDSNEISPNSNNPAASTGESENEEVAIDRARFLILARCCASSSLNFIRLRQIRRYNQSFGKGEKVPMSDLARLLRFTGSDDEENAHSMRGTTEFCRDAGLPIVEINNNGDGRDDDTKITSYVVMKSAPICIKGDDAIRRMCHPGRMNDAFVFGTRFIERNCKRDDSSIQRNGGKSSSNELLAMHVQQGDGPREDIIIDNWEDREDHVNEEFKGSSLAGTATDVRFSSSCEDLIDEDGVLIPPSNVLRNLIG